MNGMKIYAANPLAVCSKTTMRIKTNLWALVFGAAATLMMASTAQAVTLRWVLKDAVFADGGTATGSFVYNTVTEAYTNIDIVTTTGTSLPGYTFTAFDALSTVRDYGFGSNVAGMTAIGDPLLDINTTTDFNTPGTVSIGSAQTFVSSQGTCATAACSQYYPIRSLTGEVVSTAVPESATWAMMLVGFGVIGFATRLRQRIRVTYA